MHSYQHNIVLLSQKVESIVEMQLRLCLRNAMHWRVLETQAVAKDSECRLGQEHCDSQSIFEHGAIAVGEILQHVGAETKHFQCSELALADSHLPRAILMLGGLREPCQSRNVRDAGTAIRRRHR